MRVTICSRYAGYPPSQVLTMDRFRSGPHSPYHRPNHPIPPSLYFNHPFVLFKRPSRLSAYRHSFPRPLHCSPLPHPYLLTFDSSTHTHSINGTPAFKILVTYDVDVLSRHVTKALCTSSLSVPNLTCTTIRASVTVIVQRSPLDHVSDRVTYALMHPAPLQDQSGSSLAPSLYNIPWMHHAQMANLFDDREQVRIVVYTLVILSTMLTETA